MLLRVVVVLVEIACEIHKEIIDVKLVDILAVVSY